MNRSDRRATAIFAVKAGVAVVLLGLAVVSVQWLFDPFNGEMFDPAIWAVADRDTRTAMTRGAIRQVLRCQSEAEIVDLLGPPDSVSDGLFGPRRVSDDVAKTYVYCLGTTRLSSFRGYDSVFLWIYLDTDGKVIDAGPGGG